ncbi:GNAT family N-acetyltransferase [Azospirillum endophyticum]
MGLVIEPLSPRHDRRTFTCGKADLDHWFRQRADRDAHKGTRVFVAVDDTLGVVGVYSLNFITLALENLPHTQADLLPRPGSAPAAVIGSLARDMRVHGQGIGARLLMDAIHRVLGAVKPLPLIAVIAEVNDAHAAAFYDSFGFRPFPSIPERAFLRTASVMTALNGLKP